jgi:competence protein ComEA
MKTAEPAAGAPVPRDSGREATPLDPNRAGSAAFEALPGVGPVLAQRIVEERERSGPFRSPEDLLRVRGIGPSTLRRLRPYLRFETEAGRGSGS